MAGPFSQAESQVGKTNLESKALNEARNDLLNLFSKHGIDLNPQQQDKLGTISAANRDLFGQKIKGYIKTLKTPEIADLADAYFAQYHKPIDKQMAEDKTGFTNKMKTYGVSEFQGLVSEVGANWKQNQALFDKTVKEYFPSATDVPKYWRCQGIYTMNLAIQAGGDPKELANRKERLDFLVNGKTHIHAAKLAGVVDDEGEQQKIFLQNTVYGLSASQRNEWLNLAKAAGFATFVVDAVSSYYSSFMQTSDAAQTSKIAMQSVVERIRSVDELAKQKLEELREEDAGGKKLGAEEKRKKLREDAEKMLMEEEEGKKPAKKAPEPADLEQATSIRNDIRTEVRLIENARKNLVAKMPLEKAFNDPKFEEIFEGHRSEEVKETRKYFQTGMVPVKVLDAIANIRPPDVASYGPVSQLALLRAYRKTLQDYDRLTPKAR